MVMKGGGDGGHQADYFIDFYFRLKISGGEADATRIGAEKWPQ